MTQIIKSNWGWWGGGKYTAWNWLQLVWKEFSIDTDVVAQKSDLWTAASKDTGTSAGNVPVLDANWKLNTTVVPAVAITDTFTINSSSDLTWLTTAEKWDIAICPNEWKTYILYADPYSVAANWKLLPTPTDSVSSVNGKTWAVTLDADDISDSTTTNKFVTDAEKSTWGGKQDALTAWQWINITGSTIKTTYNYWESTTAAATVQKEVSIPWITELNVWQVVIVKPTITSTVADSTLKVNSFTAYPMLYNGAAITTSTDSIVWAANVPSMFILDDVSWTKYWRFLWHWLDSNTTYSINYSYDAWKMKSWSGSYAISRYSICMQKNNWTWEKITATNANYSTWTSKSVNTNWFIPTQIRYYNTTTNLANGAYAAVNTLYDKCAKLTASYSFNCWSAPWWAAWDNIYLVWTFHTDWLFYLDSTKRWDNALPTSNNWKYYIWIGNALTTTDSTMTLSIQHPIFFHDWTSIREYYTDKQDRISDLSTIRSWASAWATAVQPWDLSWYQTTSNLVTNLTSPDDTHYPSAKAVADAITASGGGDMLKSVYDPNSVEWDVYDYNNFTNTPTIPSKTSELNNDSWFVTNQVDDTAYANTWNWVTTKAPSKNAVYDKISAMDTTIGNKANDSDVVKLTWNQTVAWTKTFSTSPVVPSKSTDAANTDTAIATEAQVYKKQDKLTTQTAYTSKGTATKVPTITTNTLWQVTAITETSITFPVTSVNWSTWAVTWLQTTANLKTDLTDDSDTYYPSQKAVKTAVDGKQDSFYTSASSAPATPSEWDQWYDTTNDVLKVYDGSNWNEVWGWGGWTWDVTWPASSTDGNVVLFDWATGKIIKDSWTALSSKADAADLNTKTFYISSASDLVNAQAAYDWYVAGKNPIVVYKTEKPIYTVYDTSDWLRFRSLDDKKSWTTTATMINYWRMLSLVVSGWNVTSISTWDYTGNAINVLSTGTNYSTPYTPQYDGSPATKKYVDDRDTYIGSSAPTSNLVEWRVRYDTTNDVLKTYDGSNWNVIWGWGTTYNAWPWISIGTIQDYSAMKWPCDIWYHVPTKDEWQSVITAGVTIWAFNDSTSWWNNRTTFCTYLHLPWRYFRSRTTWNVYDNTENRYCQYWTSSFYSTSKYWRRMMVTSYEIQLQNEWPTTFGLYLRAFKDTPATPDSSWTTVYDWSGTAAWAWIFYNATLWLISISSDGTNWITIKDKNEWATTVYNYWDEVTAANAWWFFQQWNNYMFPFSWGVTTSSTQVNASDYWPWNYYESSTFIGLDDRWDSSKNNDLRWWVTWVVAVSNAISNTWVLSVNWETGNVSVQAQHSSLSVTLPAQDWTWAWVDVTVNGVTASNTVIVSPAPSFISSYTSAWIYCSAQGTDSLTFNCTGDAPSIDIIVNVVILD